MKISLYKSGSRNYWFLQTLKSAGHDAISKTLHFNPANSDANFLKRLIFEIISGIELFLKLMLDRSDIVILTTPPFIPAFLGHLACLLQRKKYILDVTEVNLSDSTFLGDLFTLLSKHMYQNAHAVLTASPGLVTKIKAIAPMAKNVELLMNGYDQELFLPSGEKYEKFTVISHDCLDFSQNIPTILKVAEDLKHHYEIQFAFIGDGPQAEIIEKCGLPNVQYWGKCHDQKIPFLIAKAHVGFCAKPENDQGRDALPQNIFEYIGVGLPVIVTPAGGYATQLADQGIFEFTNIEIKKISAQILSLKEKMIIPQSHELISHQENSKRLLKFLKP